MDELVKMLDPNLSYINSSSKGDTLIINVASNREWVYCPFCGIGSTKSHSRYIRSFQDLPIQDKKVIINLENRKMFCHNAECEHQTFSERFSFLKEKSKKTNRLIEVIIDVSLNGSTISASQTLKRNVVKISRTTVSNLLKKQ